MSKVLAVIKREYLQRVRTKAFVIGTILGPVFMAAIVGAPILLATTERAGQQRMMVVDETGVLWPVIKKGLSDTLSDGRPRFLLDQVAPEEADLEVLDAWVREKSLDGYLVVPDGVFEGEPARYAARTVSNFRLMRAVERSVDDAVLSERVKREGLDEAVVERITRPVGLKTIRLTKEGGREERGQTFLLTYVMVMLLYVSLLMYGVATMRSVIEEKSTRMVEILISSVRPLQLMFGKIAGVALVGLTQYGIWFLFAAFGLAYIGTALGADVGAVTSLLSLPLLGYFVLFFMLGYLIYASIYAAVGSMVSTEQEAQQLQMPVVMFLVLAIVLLSVVIQAPESTLATVVSIFPLTAPVLMFARICLLPPPPLEIAAAALSCLLTAVGAAWLSGRIYRVGILMYGKPPSLKELFTWVRRA
jgi:ABC-2 type transport system permease protein